VFTFVGEIDVTRFSDTGDLLFDKGTSGTLCIDFSTFPTPPFPFVQNGAGTITGGTGANSGATGTFTYKSNGAILAIDATPTGHSFGWFESSVVIHLTLP
jgi:hypothetical protein